MTGQAAGVAAARAAAGTTRRPAGDPPALPRELLRQGADLSSAVESALRGPAAAP
jgi:hypothetical protein